jgi:hypothetical protein
MYLYDTIAVDNAAEFRKQQLKLDATKYDLSSVNRIEIYGRSFTDDGDDYCEYRVIDRSNKVIAVKREAGY